MKLAVRHFAKDRRKGDVILLHGTGARAEMWEAHAELLSSNGWRCLVPHLRGHGESPEPGEKTDLQQHVGDLLETLSDFEIEYPAVFIGHSLGSVISVELASTKPDLVKKVLAVSFPARVPKLTSAIFEVFLSLPYQKIRGTPLHRGMPWRERVLIETNHHSLNQILQNFRELDYLGKMPVLNCPVHFVSGRLDPVAPARHTEIVHKNLPDSTFKIIEWAGHNCMDSQPSEFNHWLLEKMDS